ncbi:ESX secretion-associated protein EspG [Nocardia sp. NPDC049707]|uniref:ESX secretion-associated protein EspG n=1 Tax=Nocardia sp. NPDC049707 TaxID=3154735 RepID=UPI0034488030
MAEWTWDPDDFAALWYSEANDRFPNPLHYRSRFSLRDDFAAHRLAVCARYDRDEFEHIQLAVHTLANSDLRIEILGGTTKHRAGDGTVKIYRMVGARTPEHAVTLFQSATTDEDGQIRLRTGRPETLAIDLARAIPACASGSHEPATFHPEDLRPRRDTYLEDVARSTPRERYERLVHRPADGGGTAGLITGPINTLSEPRHVLRWHDITDDGRYTEIHGPHITVRPTTPADLAATFTTWINHTLEHLHESEEYTR